jgi:NAD(P)-dependent dehydrogenase (short-subunit alcohol dehydrogenase family)
MTDLELKGRTAVVTGAGSGIGRALALRAAAEGMALAICDVDEEGLAETAAMVRARGAVVASAALDVRDPTAVQTFAADSPGSIALLFANAGILRAGPLASQPAADIQLMFEVNVLGVMNTLQAFLARMTADPRPSRAVITGSQASFVLFSDLGAYTATKHALLAVAETLGRELANTPVGVCLIAPGPVATAILGRAPDPGGRMSAQEAAEIAFAGACRGDFLISTHADLGPRLDRRHTAFQAMLRQPAV